MSKSLSGNYRIRKQQVKTAKGRTSSSINWLKRHINDPYVRLAKAQGYVSRAAFKLLEIDEKYKLISDANVIIDIGAAPGGWLQVVAEKKKKNTIFIGIDLLKISLLLPNLELVQGNFLAKDVQTNIIKNLVSKPDLIVSDIAVSASGDRSLDHLRNTELIMSVIEFAGANLEKNGNLIFKLIRGKNEQIVFQACKKSFGFVKMMKPKASYSDSAEMYVICLGKLKNGPDFFI